MRILNDKSRKMENVDDTVPDDVYPFGKTQPLLGSYDNVSMVLESSPSSSSSSFSSSFSQMTSNGMFQSRDESLAKAEIAIQAAVLVLTIAGNGAVLAMLGSLARYKDLGRMYTMIGHLSCADLFVAVFNLLPQLAWDITHRFRGGRALCKAVKYLQVAAMYASSYVLVSTAVDRYTAICHPMRSHTWTSTTAHRLVAAAWALSLAFAVPQLVIFDYVEIQPGSGVRDCWVHFSPRWTLSLYVTWFALAVYVIPLVVLATIYVRICTVVWRSAGKKQTTTTTMTSCHHVTKPNEWQRRSCVTTDDLGVTFNGTVGGEGRGGGGGGGGAGDGVGASTPVYDHDPFTRIESNHHHHQQQQQQQQQQYSCMGLSKAKTKTVKLTLTVVVSYLLCWGPFFVSQMWSAWDPLAPFEVPAMVITLLLGNLNSCINPWIYLAFSDQLRRKVVHCCRPPRAQRPSTASYELTDFRSGSRPTHS